jgi:hypothetical protein
VRFDSTFETSPKFKDVPLFKSEKIVDMLKNQYFIILDPLVDDIAATFELDRSDLSLLHPPIILTLNYSDLLRISGLICGSRIAINLVSGDVLHCNDDRGTFSSSLVGQISLGNSHSRRSGYSDFLCQ